MKMKFKEMQYERISVESIAEEEKKLIKALKEAKSFAEAEAAFLEEDKLSGHISTMSALASIRHSIDTTDKFYDDEQNYWNNAFPQIQVYSQEWTQALLASPFRKEFEEKYGSIIFVNAEMELKTFSPEIIPLLQQENELVTAYEKLLANAEIPFEGEHYTISQMSPFKNDPDDARRLAAWKAEGQWYKDNQEELDRIYDQLVKLRDEMGKKLGYENFLPLGYYRMQRNSYDKNDVEKFRAAVQKYVVPVAVKVYERQAKRLGKTYPMSYADNAMEFRSGNPKPQGTPDDIVAVAKKFYEWRSPETAEFFNHMIEDELMGLTFRLSPASFYQVNAKMTEKLYETALSFAKLTPNDTVLDAYCGVGTIGMAACRSAGQVIGVELNKAAVRDAIANAKRNGIENIRFFADDASDFLLRVAESGEKLDAIIMAPPRSGSTERFLESACKVKPKRIVYVSCNPETLARDLQLLKRWNYHCERIVPIDNFPLTEHLETVCLLSRKDK